MAIGWSHNTQRRTAEFVVNVESSQLESERRLGPVMRGVTTSKYQVLIIKVPFVNQREPGMKRGMPVKTSAEERGQASIQREHLAASRAGSLSGGNI